METRNMDTVDIRIVFTDCERIEAVAFIESQMRRIYKCEPPPTTGIIFVARLQDKIVGSIVICGTDKSVPFPVEENYSFDATKTPFLFDHSVLVQTGRWISIHPGVSLILLRAAFGLASQLGKRYALIEAKPYSAKRINELGFICKEIQDVKIRGEHILKLVGENGMRYFTEFPLPSLYMIKLT